MLKLSRVALFSVFLAAAVLPACAQEFGPALLPADTSFLVYSRGTAQATAAFPDNPMVKAWSAPEIVQLRRQALQYFVRNSSMEAGGYLKTVAPADLDRFLSLLESPMMFGFSGPMDPMQLAQTAANPSGELKNAGGLFLIVDVSRQSPQFDRLWKVLEANIPKQVTLTRHVFSGATIETFSGPHNTNFASRVGNYFVWSTAENVIQTLVSRLATHPAPSTSLVQDSTFQSCLQNAAAGPLSEVFFRVPDLTKFPPAAASRFDFGAALRTLHFSAIHAVCGSFSITSQGENSRWLVLGDPSSGGLFDIAGTNRPHFETLALAPESASSFTASSFDLPAIYKVLRAAALAGLPSQQQSSIQMAEMMAGAELSMPLPSALAMVSGEIASIQTGAGAPGAPRVLALTLANSQQFLALVHKLAGGFLVEEPSGDGLTLLKLVTPAAAAPKSSQPPPPSYYFAITPHFLLAGTDKDVLRRTARLDVGRGDGKTLADDPEIKSPRERLPNAVLGLSIADYTRFDISGQITEAFGQILKQNSAKLSPEDVQFFDNLLKIGSSELFRTMLHRSVGAWWKDADGVHFENFTQ